MDRTGRPETRTRAPLRAPRGALRGAPRPRMIRAALAFAALVAVGLPRLPARAAPIPEEAPYVEGMVLVRLADGATADERQRFFDELGAREIRPLPWKGYFAVMLAHGTTAEAVARFKSAPAVASIEPNGRVYATGPVPDDPEFLKQWHLRNVGQPTDAGVGTPGADIDAPMAWCVSRGDPGVVVATLDTGVRYDHPDLAACIFRNPGEIPGNGVDDDHNGKIDDVRGWDFEDHLVTGGDNDPLDTHGHGTLVAGVIAAAEDGQGAVGVAPGVTILPIRVLTDTNTSPPSGTHLQAALGIHYAVEMGARVINCSFGSFQPAGVVEAAILEARTDQIMVVCGAGNERNNNDSYPFYPASYPYENVISVTASTPDDAFADSFANFGLSSVDLAAPGVAVWGPVYRGANPYEIFGSASGTSFATPQVSGALALLESFLPGLEHPTPREALLASVDWLPTLTGTSATGGRLNVHRLLASVAPADAEPPAAVSDHTAARVGSYRIELEWTAPGDDGNTGQACCYDLRRSLSPIGPSFGAAEEIIAPRPSAPGSLEHLSVEGLEPNTTYYFALRTRDEAYGISPTSNELVVTTLPANIDVTPRSIEAAAKTGEHGLTLVQVHNLSATDLTFSATTRGEWLSVTPAGAVIPPGELQGLQLTWNTSGIPGVTVQGALDIASDAVGAELVSVPVTLSVTSAPELDVAPAALDLGTSFVDHGMEMPLTIRNLGFRTLVVDDITSDVDGVAVTPSSFSLGPGSEREVLVAYVPASPGAVQGTVSIYSNDPFDLPFDVPVTAVAVVPPVLDLSAESVAAVGITGVPTPSVPLVVRNLQTGGPALELVLAVVEAAGAGEGSGEGGGAPVWLAVEPSSVTVPPGGEAEVLLEFSTANVDPGLFAADLALSSNDPNRSQVVVPVTFDVSGIAGLVFEAEAGAFGTTPAGTFDERILPVANSGNDTLRVEVRLHGPFAAGPAELRVPPGGTGELCVRYRPVGETRDAAMLRLVTNDPDHPWALLPLTGQGRRSGDWSGTIRLDRHLEVPAGETLTIDAGTRVEAYAPLGMTGVASPTALDVRGRLVVRGTEEAPVELGTNEDADWEGVVVSGAVELTHAVVSGARIALRAGPGAQLDVACSRVTGNDVGLDYAGAAGSGARLADTRWENRITNLRLDGVAGLDAYGVPGSATGRNVFAVSDDPGGGWNVQAVSAAPELRLDGNAWLDPQGRLWPTGSLGAILATIDGLPSDRADVLPLLESLPLPCGQSPPPPPAPDLPATFSFARAVPNPIRSDVTVDFDLPAGFLGRVVVDVFDVRGARVRRLVEKYPVTTGMYFLRLETADYESTRKVLVLR